MWRMKFKSEVFRSKGVKDVIVENCPNPECDNDNLRYPVDFNGASCPSCKCSLPGYHLSEYEYTRRQYHTRLAHCTIDKVMRCTN